MNPLKINRILGDTGGGAKNVLLTFNKSYLYAAGNLILTLDQYNEGLFYHLFVEKVDEEIVKYLFSLGAHIKIYDCEINLGFNTEPFHPVQAIRLFVPYLLEDNIGKLVYIDDDMVCKGNIDELFDTPFDDFVIAMAPGFGPNFWDKVPAFNIPHPTTLYCNAGVVVIDVKRYKQSKSVDSLYEAFASIADKLDYFDQDFINICFHGRIHFLKQIYNFYTVYFRFHNYEQMLKEAKLIHFIGKPWNWKTSFRVKKAFLEYSIDKTIKRKVRVALAKRIAIKTIQLPLTLVHYILFLIYQPFKLIKPIRNLKEKIIKQK